MNEPEAVSSSIEQLIAQARQNPEMLGRLLERYRAFLLLSLRPRSGPKLAVRCNPSDVVQQTLTEAYQGFDRFLGSTEAQFSAWILRINHNNLIDAIRKHVKEINQEEHPTDVSIIVDGIDPGADPSTPSQKMIRGEKALRLAAVLESLPEMQREAVRLRHLEGCSVKEAAQRLDRSPAATAVLIKKGLQKLRETMSEQSWS